MGYERCEKHNLMGCAMCNPRARGAVVTAALLVPPPTAAWSPEDALDSPLVAVSDTQEQVPDKQALEAMERQKEIQKKNAELEAAGTLEVPTAMMIDSDLERLKAEKTELLRKLEQPGSVVEVDGDPTKTALPVVAPNPIVRAAEEYTKAQAHVTASAANIAVIRLRLAEAEGEYAEAVADRDLKKEVLQKLVQS